MAETERPKFRPQINTLRVNLKRVVRLAQYESYDVMLGLEAEPDGNYTTGENFDRLIALVRAKVDGVADSFDPQPEPAQEAK